MREERVRKTEESREKEKKISGWITIICALAILYVAEQAGTVPFLIVFFAMLIIYALQSK